MRILAVALADEAQRYMKGYPPRGSWLFREPLLEISCLAELVSGTDELVYQDQRIQSIQPDGDQDLCLVHVGLGQDSGAREANRVLEPATPRILFFGPQATAWADSPPDWVRSHVVGDILNVWDEIRSDAAHSRLRRTYTASPTPSYHQPRRPFGRSPEMNSFQQTVRFLVGCSCPESVRHLCRHYLYYGENRLCRTREEIVGEVLSLPRKHIRLLDDDVAAEPEYYHDLFRLLWNYRKHWTVNAGVRLFDRPELVRLLAKAGTRIIFLNETAFPAGFETGSVSDRTTRELYRRVKYLQSRRMLVGARLTLGLDSDRPTEYDALARALCRADLDFIEVRGTAPVKDRPSRLVPVSYRPMVGPGNPAWLKNRFYAMETILDRLARRPRRVGFYNTGRYLLPYSLAYRQNCLEGIPFP